MYDELLNDLEDIAEAIVEMVAESHSKKLQEASIPDWS